MASIVVPASKAPPDNDKPWLLSTRGELAKEQADTERYKKDFLQRHPFPGVTADLPAKLAWLGALQKEYDQKQWEWSPFQFGGGPEACVIARQTLQEHSPKHIWLELFCSKWQLRVIGKYINESAFTKSNLEKYGNREYKGKAVWREYRAWLLEHGAAAGLKDEDNNDAFLIASFQCNCDDKVNDCITTLVSGLGLDMPFDSASLLKDEEHFTVCHLWGVMKLMGENLYHPAATDPKAAAVQLHGNFIQLSEIGKKNALFRRSLNEMKKQTKDTNKPKAYLTFLKPECKVEADVLGFEPEQLYTADTASVLWLPLWFEEERDRIIGAFAGRHESRSIQRRLGKGNTDSGNLMVGIFESQYDHIKTYRTWQEKFCAALALTLEITDSLYWMDDNEYQSELVDLVRKFGQWWRTSLLKRTDQELGIDDGNVSVTGKEGEMSASRTVLYSIMEFCSKRLDCLSHREGKIELKWKPPPSRQRKKQKIST